MGCSSERPYLEEEGHLSRGYRSKILPQENIQQLARIKTHTYSCLVLDLSKQIVTKKDKDAYQGDTEVNFATITLKTTG